MNLLAIHPVPAGAVGQETHREEAGAPVVPVEECYVRSVAVVDLDVGCMPAVVGKGKNQDVAESVLIGSISFDKVGSRLVKTYFKGLKREAPKSYLDLEQTAHQVQPNTPVTTNGEK